MIPNTIKKNDHRKVYDNKTKDGKVLEWHIDKECWDQNGNECECGDHWWSECDSY